MLTQKKIKTHTHTHTHTHTFFDVFYHNLTYLKYIIYDMKTIYNICAPKKSYYSFKNVICVARKLTLVWQWKKKQQLFQILQNLLFLNKPLLIAGLCHIFRNLSMKFMKPRKNFGSSLRRWKNLSILQILMRYYLL